MTILVNKNSANKEINFLIYGSRSELSNYSLDQKIACFFMLFFSEFRSLRLLEKRYFESRLLILNTLLKADISLLNKNISISHSGNSFFAIVFDKNSNLVIDHEPLERRISKALEKKIRHYNNPKSLSSLQFLNILETLIKMKNIRWKTLLSIVSIREFSLKKNFYLVKLGSDLEFVTSLV